MKELHEMNQYELDELIKQAKETKSQTKQQAIATLRAKIAEVQSECGALGTTLAALTRVAREKVYFNPAKPSQGWSGKGRKPKWVEAILAAEGGQAVLEGCRAVKSEPEQQ